MSYAESALNFRIQHTVIPAKAVVPDRVLTRNETRSEICSETRNETRNKARSLTHGAICSKREVFDFWLDFGQIDNQTQLDQ